MKFYVQYLAYNKLNKWQLLSHCSSCHHPPPSHSPRYCQTNRSNHAPCLESSTPHTFKKSEFLGSIYKAIHGVCYPLQAHIHYPPATLTVWHMPEHSMLFTFPPVPAHSSLPDKPFSACHNTDSILRQACPSSSSRSALHSPCPAANHCFVYLYLSHQTVRSLRVGMFYSCLCPQ